jgi:hypothetical protein
MSDWTKRCGQQAQEHYGPAFSKKSADPVVVAHVPKLLHQDERQQTPA